MLAKGSCLHTELKSLLGKLQFVCNIIPAGRCFLRRLHNLSCGPRSARRPILLPQDARADLELWSQFLADFNGRCLLSFGTPFTSAELNLQADASKYGYGATFGSKFIQGVFPPEWSSRDIQSLELYPIAAVLSLFAPRLSGSSILIRSDNLPIVHALNNHTSRNKDVMAILRPLVLCLMRAQIRVKAVHVRGTDNTVCDRLSRQQATPAFLANHGLDPHPTLLPPHLLPGNFAEW